MFTKFIIALIALIVAFVASHPLDDYINNGDDSFSWTQYGDPWRIDKIGITGYYLNVTSQRWLTDAAFSPNSPAKSLWTHWLVVIVPDVIDFKQNASMYLTGGDVNSLPPSPTSEDVAVAIALAYCTGIPTGALFGIPNEHTIFADDLIQKSRTEDAIIAWTWDRFLAKPDEPEWLVRFPMVKAAVRAMDAMTEFVGQKYPEVQIEHYAVAGASKRGWTSWLVGAVDQPRTNAIMPLVLDAINFQKVEHHQFQSYGGWTYALEDYLEMNIMARIDNPNMALLSQMEDPYFFFDRLANIPKLVVNAVWDEFQQPDDLHYWWNDLKGKKHFIMTPNAEHSLATGIFEIVPSIIAYQTFRLNDQPVPTFTWTIDKGTGEIVATLDRYGEVYEANVWYGYSCGKNTFDGVTRRDWRVGFPDAQASADLPYQCASGCGLYSASEEFCANLKSVFTKEPLAVQLVGGKRTYKARIEPPTDGRYVAFFIEITYRKPKNTLNNRAFDFSAVSPNTTIGKGLLPMDLYCRLVVTTEVSILPDTFPYADCHDETCDGPIV